MCHRRNLSNKVHEVHEKALKTVHSDYKSGFQKLPQKDNCLIIYQKSLQHLAIEVQKI